MNFVEQIINTIEKRNVETSFWRYGEDWEIYSLAGINKKHYCNYDVKDMLRIEYNRTTRKGLIQIRVDGYEYKYQTDRLLEGKEYFTKSKIMWDGLNGGLGEYKTTGSNDRALKLALNRFIKKNVG